MLNIHLFEDINYQKHTYPSTMKNFQTQFFHGECRRKDNSCGFFQMLSRNKAQQIQTLQKQQVFIVGLEIFF